MSDSKVKVKEEDVELEDMEDEEEGGESGDTTQRRTLNGSLTAYQNHLEMMQTLPPSVKRRIKALKRLQFESTKIEAKFYEEYHALEMKYLSLYQPLRDKRMLMVNGDHEPTEEEAQWPSDDEKEDDLCSEAKSKMKIEETTENTTPAATEEKNKKNENVKGVPDFWLVIFKNVGILAEMVQEHDEPILHHLKDITVQLTEKPMGFNLEFHFAPNDYFNNTVLVKQYEMKCEPDESDPFGFEGPEIIKCKGCTIDWKKGKNVTIKVVKKKQKHRARGSIRTVTRTIQNDSFFNFFNPPVAEEPDGEIDDHIQSILTADFEIGHYIRERIVPNAVLYFTGEALEDEEYEEEEEEEEDGDEEDKEGNDAYCRPSNARGPMNPAECKQQ